MRKEKPDWCYWIDFLEDLDFSALCRSRHYSERPGTLAAKKIVDDVPEEVKQKRLSEIIAKQREHSQFRTAEYLGKTLCVLVEKTSKKFDTQWSGRTSQNTVVVFPKEKYQIGDFVDVKIENCTSATLIGSGLDYSKSI